MSADKCACPSPVAVRTVILNVDLTHVSLGLPIFNDSLKLPLDWFCITCMPFTSLGTRLMIYSWNVVTVLVLLNVLISLFSSAYQDVSISHTRPVTLTRAYVQVVDDAEAQYLAFFASKTVGMIRAPDSFVYPAPFNLVEICLVSPFE